MWRKIPQTLVRAPARLLGCWRWQSVAKCPGWNPVLSFGGVLESGRLVHGGAVKLLTLRDSFDCHETNCNLLYMVSSAQPAFASDLAGILGRKGIPLVWNQNGVGYPAWAGRDTERHNAPMRQLLSSATHVVYQSEFCRSSADKFLGHRAQSSSVLLNPVDLLQFCPPNAVLPLQPLRLLSMGTQNYRERAIASIDCLAQLRNRGHDCRLTIAGPLLWKGAAADIISRAEAVDVAGYLDLKPPFHREEAADIYRAHHVLLHPKYLDPCPTVVAEALSCGLPVVASRSGGIPEMTNGDCAELIDVPIVWDRLITPDGPQMADAVERILARYATATRAARSCAEILFDSTRWVEKHREIFSTVLH